MQIDATLEIGPVGDATELLASVYRRSRPIARRRSRFTRWRRCWTAAAVSTRSSKGRCSTTVSSTPRNWRGSTRNVVAHFRSDPRADRGAGAWWRSRIFTSWRPPGQAAVQDWLLTVDPARTPRFDLQHSSIRLERRSLRVDSDALEAAAHQLFIERANRVRQPRAERRGRSGIFRPQPGRDRKIGTYYSMQAAVSDGLRHRHGRAAAVAPRRAQGAGQAAEGLSDVLRSAAGELLRPAGQRRHAVLLPRRDTPTRTSRSRSPTSPTARSAWTDSPRGSGARGGPATNHRRPMGQGEPRHPSRRRRNRLLDHLLARVGEQFTRLLAAAAWLVANDDVPRRGPPGAATSGRSCATIPRIGRDRGVGFNYLARRLQRLLRVPAGRLSPTPSASSERLTAASPDPLSAFLWTQTPPDEQDRADQSRRARGMDERDPVRLFNRVIHAGSRSTPEIASRVWRCRTRPHAYVTQRRPRVADDLVRLNRAAARRRVSGGDRQKPRRRTTCPAWSSCFAASSASVT